MSTLTEIEAAVASLPQRDKKELMIFLERQLSRPAASHVSSRRGLKAAKRPALEGLPPELSTGTKQRARALIAGRHAANR